MHYADRAADGGSGGKIRGILAEYVPLLLHDRYLYLLLPSDLLEAGTGYRTSGVLGPLRPDAGQRHGFSPVP